MQLDNVSMLKCEECAFTTRSKHSLRIHRLRHMASEEKQFKCKVCNYATNYKSNLDKHKRIHTGEKPYMCRFCGKRFSSQSNKKTHEWTHQRHMKLTCPVPNCGYSTNSAKFMDEHRRRQHGQETIAALPAMSVAFPGIFPPQAIVSQAQAAQLGLGDAGTPAWTTTAITNVDNSQPVGAHGDASVHPFSITINESWHTTYNEQVNGTNHQPRAGVIEVDSDDCENDIKPEIRQRNSQSEATDLSSSDHNAGDSIQGKDDGANEQDLGLDDAPVPTTGYIRRQPTVTTLRKPSTERLQRRNLSDSERNASATAVDSTTSPHPRGPNSFATLRHSSFEECILQEAAEHFISGTIHEDQDVNAILEGLIRTGKIHRCGHCNVLFPEYSMFILHMGSHGSENPFQCHFCKAVFLEKFGFLTHFMQCIKK